MEVTFDVDLAGLLAEFKPKKKEQKGLGKVTFTKPAGPSEEWVESGTESIGEDAGTRCWWDHHPLPSQADPVVIPGLAGPTFCSYECAMAFILGTYNASKSERLLKALRHSFKKDHPTEKFRNLDPAPSLDGLTLIKTDLNDRLIAYGGRTTIEKYRSGHHPKKRTII